MKQASLLKGKQLFVLCYDNAAQALDTLCDWANNRDLDFDWFDAGIMAHQVGMQFVSGVERNGG